MVNRRVTGCKDACETRPGLGLLPSRSFATLFAQTNPVYHTHAKLAWNW